MTANEQPASIGPIDDDDQEANRTRNKLTIYPNPAPSSTMSATGAEPSLSGGWQTLRLDPPAHHAEPYAPPAPAAEPSSPLASAEERHRRNGLGPAENCGDPECLCGDPFLSLVDDPAGYAAAPTVEPDQERAPRRRRRRRYDPAAVLAVMLAGVQVGRAVRNLVETIRVVQESGGIL